MKYSQNPRNPLGSALGISFVLRLHFTVYPSSRRNTDTISAEGVEESHTVEPDEIFPYSTLNILTVAGRGLYDQPY